MRRNVFHRSFRAGFSLVELSIVLVILGLLTGGILAGQSLIRASELRAVSTEYNRWITAGQTFRDKYFAIPGDVNNATSFWGKSSTLCNAALGSVGTPGTCNGNADGILDNGGASAVQEKFLLWQHLAFSGLIEGTYTGVAGISFGDNSDIGINVPASRLSMSGWSARNGSNIAVGNSSSFAADYGNYLVVGSEGADVNATIYGSMTPTEAWNIDTKLDDGIPGTGRIIAFFRDGCSISSSATVPGTYRFDATDRRCSLFFTRAF